MKLDHIIQETSLLIDVTYVVKIGDDFHTHNREKQGGKNLKRENGVGNVRIYSFGVTGSVRAVSKDCK